MNVQPWPWQISCPDTAGCLTTHHVRVIPRFRVSSTLDVRVHVKWQFVRVLTAGCNRNWGSFTVLCCGFVTWIPTLQGWSEESWSEWAPPVYRVWLHCNSPHYDPVACNTNSDRNIAIHIPDYTASPTEYRSLGNSRKYVKIYKNLLFLFFNPYFVGGTCSMVEMRNACKILLRMLERKRTFGGGGAYKTVYF
jgi:hypothetical protein